MDIRTGKTYDTREAALADGVPASDIADVRERVGREPDVTFATGPFKGRIYKRDPLTKALVRVDARRRRT